MNPREPRSVEDIWILAKMQSFSSADHTITRKLLVPSNPLARRMHENIREIMQLRIGGKP